MDLRSLALAIALLGLGGCRCSKGSDAPTPAASSTVTISIESEPVGATVTIDGTTVGVTPVHAAVAPGQRRLLLTKDGFISHQSDVKIGEGLPSSFKASLLMKK